MKFGGVPMMFKHTHMGFWGDVRSGGRNLIEAGA